MKYKTMWLLAANLLFLCVAGCVPFTPAPTPTPVGPQTLRVMTHDSFAVSEEVIRAFESQYNATVQIIPSGDAGTALSKAILARGNPIADVFYGVDNTFFSRALSENIYLPYTTPLLSEIPNEFKMDAGNRALPVDYADVCPNYDIGYFQEKGLAPPASLEDLARPEYKGMLVVENPATSSTGLAFMLATIGHFGEDGYLDYWKSLVENDVLVVNDWTAAYYTEFSLHEGARPLVISYNSSPAAEVIYADPPVESAPSAAITANGSCFRQIEFAGILDGTSNAVLARQWIDFMLSKEFQEDMPLQMFVYPVNPQAALPEQFVRYSQPVAEASTVTPNEISRFRDQWVQDWTDVVLR